MDLQVKKVKKKKQTSSHDFVTNCSRWTQGQKRGFPVQTSVLFLQMSYLNLIW